ncbi:NO-inducible flavohemoprotein [Gallaecimonas kandeliae]|uniref:NO-inducible flavohemoprotein n=1 Tax=Gallaecimonas kandeliae TaxID=3029055 RepID=UPI00264A3541|nr:NO-inducible flavohemoprotein [Gallaecimonas kandeliae]WKE65843.1 NO-inducible flavohemoprotein [Gallaecimonas kandeliae]
MLSASTIAHVKATIPVLEQAGPAITAHFYQRMFSHNPELKDIFNLTNQQTGRQQVALFEAIAAYAKHIETPEVLAGAVERIAQKHTSFVVKPEHYAIVGGHLLATLQELAPEVFDEATTAAWAEAYHFLAGIFIDREGTLYEVRRQAQGGWAGERRFRLVAKTPESERVTSFVWEPVDGGAVLSFEPGQYIGIKVHPAGSDYNEIRQYSLSDKSDGRRYRISVKREGNGEQQGLVSNHLHDQVQVGDEVALIPPAGDFFLDQESQSPVVLVSAGVGLTPMMAMLETLCAGNSPRPVHFLHACENAAQHSFKDRVVELAGRHGVNTQVWYREGEALQHSGLMDIAKVKATLPIADGDFYLCGPMPFMASAKSQLLEAGVDEGRIHYEAFGPHVAL